MSEVSVGCMVAAAYGDSLGAAVEFMTLGTIRSEYGFEGIRACRPAFGQPAGCITDDTQMALATAEGLLRGGDSHEAVLADVYREYLRWYDSQRLPANRRGPGSTCLSALGSGQMGTVTDPLNQSPGCGGIMRVHPVGLWAANAESAFEMGLATAAITHGADNAFLPSAAFAVIIHCLSTGDSLDESVSRARGMVEALGSFRTRGTLRSMEIAMDTAIKQDIAIQIDEEIGQLGADGGGWHGHDALAIALFAMRTSGDPVQIAANAVNHSGDSDSTGSLAGAMAGILYGEEPFVKALEQSGVELEQMDLLRIIGERLSRLHRS